jgi:hypothetical protein
MSTLTPEMQALAKADPLAFVKTMAEISIKRTEPAKQPEGEDKHIADYVKAHPNMPVGQAELAARREWAQAGHVEDTSGSWSVAFDPANNNVPFEYNSKTNQSRAFGTNQPYTPGGFVKTIQNPRTAVAMYMQGWDKENPKATSADRATAMNVFAGQQSEQRVLGTTGAKIESSNAGLDTVITQANEAYSKLPRGQFVPFNSLQKMAETNAFSSPEQADAYAADTGAINMWAKAINPSGVLTIENARRGAEMLNQAQSTAAHQAVLERMLKEGSAALGGVNAYRNIGPNITTTAAPTAAPGGAAAPGAGGNAIPRISSAADYNALAKGTTYIDPQGHTRKKP